MDKQEWSVAPEYKYYKALPEGVSLSSLVEITDLSYTLEESLDDRFYPILEQPEYQIWFKSQHYHDVDEIFTNFLEGAKGKADIELEIAQKGYLGFLNYDPGMKRINNDIWIVWVCQEDYCLGLKLKYYISHDYLMKILSNIRGEQVEIMGL